MNINFHGVFYLTDSSTKVQLIIITSPNDEIAPTVSGYYPSPEIDRWKSLAVIDKESIGAYYSMIVLV